jgi:APA family basic amino acid/polyamine antiporter
MNRGFRIMLETEKPKEQFAYTKKNGLLGATMIGVTSLTGAGIYSLLSYMADIAGPATILSFVIDLLLAMLIAGCSSECASLIPASGGGFVYVVEAFGKKGVYIGWIVWLSNMSYGSLCAITAGIFVGDMLGISNPFVIIGFAVAFVVLFTLFNLRGSKTLQMIQNPLMVAVLTTLVIGSIYLFLNPTGNAFVNGPFMPNGFPSVFVGSALFLDIFIGFEDLASVAEEIEKPKINIPKALRYCLIVAAIFYFLVIYAIFSTMNIDAIKSTELPFMEGMRGNPVIYTIVFLGAIFTLLTSVGVAVMAASRNIQALARLDFLDRRWSEINPKLQAPVNAIWLSCILTIVIVLSNQVDYIAAISNISYIISVIFIALAIFKFRKTCTYDKDTYKMKYHPAGPILTIVVCIFLLFFIDVDSIYISIGWLLSGFLLYIAFSSKRRAYGAVFLVATFFVFLVSAIAGFLIMIAGFLAYLFSIANQRSLYLALSGIAILFSVVLFLMVAVFLYFGHYVYAVPDATALSAVIIIALLGSMVFSFGSNILDLSPVARHMTFPKDGMARARDINHAARIKRRGRRSNRLFKILNAGQVVCAILLAIYAVLLLSGVIQIREIIIRGIPIDGVVFTFFYTLIVVALAAALLIKGLLGIKYINVGDVNLDTIAPSDREINRAAGS